MLEQIEAIYFDLDNTLINRDGAFYLCVKDFYKAFPDVQIDLDLILKKDNHGYTPRQIFFDWLVKEYPIEGVTSAQFFDYVVENIGAYVVPDLDILALLETVAKSYKMGILTNGSIRNQTNKVKNSGLDSIFDDTQIIISQQYQIAKPDSKLFELILHKLNLDTEKILYVGDNPKNDIFGASQLGIKTCWVSHGLKWDESYSFDVQVGSVEGLLKVLINDYSKEQLEAMISESMHFGNFVFDVVKKLFLSDVEILVVLKRHGEKKYESVAVFFDGQEISLEGEERHLFSGTEKEVKNKAIVLFGKGKYFLIYPIVLTNINCDIID